jgi:PAS domain S-box-containing protein
MSVGTMRWLDEHRADLAALLAIDGNKTDLLELAEQLGQIGHWRVSLSDKSLTWSAAIYRIHGVTPDGYTPDIQSALTFYHPDDRDAVTNTLTRAARDGMPFEFSLRLIRADGELRHVKSRGLTIPGSDGVPSAIFGVFLDVTEQHEANLKLERMAYVDAPALVQILSDR